MSSATSIMLGLGIGLLLVLAFVLIDGWIEVRRRNRIERQESDGEGW